MGKKLAVVFACLMGTSVLMSGCDMAGDIYDNVKDAASNAYSAIANGFSEAKDMLEENVDIGTDDGEDITLSQPAADPDQEMYTQLLSEMNEISAGKRTNNELELSGIVYTDKTDDDISDIVASTLLQITNNDLYAASWMNLSEGVSIKELKSSDGSTEVKSLTIKPAAEYQADDGSVDASKVVVITTAYNNAAAIAAQYDGYDVTDRLRAYTQYICDTVTYDTSAAEEYNANKNIPYTMPWQFVGVFDDDTDTNVVCEGYAKAFKLLCDLSGFSQTSCSLASGTLNGEPHMWNEVNVNGSCYLVDVTQMDAGYSSVFMHEIDESAGQWYIENMVYVAG